MIRTKIAKKVLKKSEQNHLTKCGINSIADMKRQLAFMKKLNPEDPGQVCRECRSIAFKIELI